MRVVHYYARYLQHRSGVTDSIENWVRQARRSGHDAMIVCAAVASPRELPADVGDAVRTVAHVGRGRTSWVPTGLGRTLAPGDALYLHEGWVLSNLAAAHEARRRGATVVVMPHGVYETGITSRLRDVVGIRRRAERAVLRRADWLHVFYPSEADLVDDVAPRRSAATLVLPNGAPDADAVPRWCGGAGYYLWMGRYDLDHKGVDNLLRRWAELPAPRPRLVLAGPDFRGGRRRTADLVAELGLGGTVEVRGNATGEDKARLMRECRAYLHPSRWESCSILLLEMLAAGVPTVVSATIHAAAPLARAGAVVVHDFGRPGGLGAVLGAVDGDEELSRAARTWVHGTATWDRLGEEYGAWLAGLEEGVRA
ncbi:glycosyltransferase family 4 protein [Cellulosimicrobium cellulans]|uniref:glycosyltransferase family 4 protein n=1 Tax=Cellulosimicrobium cellulans TaxID=1710 RepID=UPI000848D751|nr:glycosyltransferase family 4 protein [Cellulosimicrobium cellulans]